MAVMPPRPPLTDATAAAPRRDREHDRRRPATSDRFLKLLVAQMQNQDPLNPMDNAQVTTQMAQISTVTGIDKLNRTVQAPVERSSCSCRRVQGASLVGRDVVVAGNKLQRRRRAASAQGGFELTGAGRRGQGRDPRAPSGKVVDTLNLGAQTPAAHSFDWRPAQRRADGGADASGSPRRAAASATAATTLMRDRVDAVSTAGTTLQPRARQRGHCRRTASIKAFN